MSVDLLERGHEVEEIGDALAQAEAGTGTLVVIEGAAGVGKTQLLGVGSGEARARGMRAMGARGFDLERQYSFGVARQLFVSVLRDSEAALAGPAAFVRPLLDPSLPASGGDGEYPFLHGFFWLVGNLSETAPVALVIDDAHWADAQSLRALIYLIQRLRELPVCVLLAIREGEPGSPVELLAALKVHPDSRVLRPGPLSTDAVNEIVRRRLGEVAQVFADACATVSGGNPFLLGELLATIAAERVAPTAAGARRVRELVPERVQGHTLARLARLGPDATALAQSVAVLDSHSDMGTIAALAGVSLPEAAAVADALTAAGVLGPGPSPSFAHPLLRSAVYAGIGPAERARMHGEAARLKDRHGALAAEVAAQLLAAERTADPWAVGVLRRAARGALDEGAPASASRYLERALEEPPRTEDRGEVLAELAGAEAAAGGPLATEHLRAAVEELDDPRRRVELRIALAGALYHHGHGLEAADVLDAAREDLGPDDRELGLEVEAAFISVARLDSSLRARAMPRLAELSQGLRGETPIERVLLAHEANRRVFAGDPHHEVRELVLRAWADGQLLKDRQAGGFAPITALAALGWCDDFDGYESRLGELQADARRRGLVLAYADATYGLHMAHHYRGRLADAVADVEAALETRDYGWRRHLATASSQLVWTLIELGDLASAERVLARPDVEESRGTLAFALVHDARGRLALARGDSSAALEEFLAAGRVAESAPIANPSYLPWRSSAAVAAGRLGRREQALELAAEELRRAVRFGAPRPIGVAQRASALVAGGDEGIERLRTAVETLAGSPAGLEHSRALVDLGAALRRSGHRRDARPPLTEGLELAAGFGALVLEQRARDELAATGAHPGRRRFSGIDALTPSERRVAEMAAGGMTNRQIAEALFVTVKAVHWHLGNTYRKLGVSDRDALPAALRSTLAAPS